MLYKPTGTIELGPALKTFDTAQEQNRRTALLLKVIILLICYYIIVVIKDYVMLLIYFYEEICINEWKLGERFLIYACATPDSSCRCKPYAKHGRDAHLQSLAHAVLWPVQAARPGMFGCCFLGLCNVKAKAVADYGVLACVVFWLYINVSKEHTVSIFRGNMWAVCRQG
jgi:hypothetical protein